MGSKIVAVVMGGYSSEFDISLKSGGVVLEALSDTPFIAYAVQIRKDGWFYVGKNGSEFEVNKSDFGFEVDGKHTIPDVIFNTVHGTPGEDGLLQAYWTLLKIPHTSPKFYPSAISFNKRDCLSVLKGFGIKCANSVYVNRGIDYDKDEIVKVVGLPCFVKPNRSGSSYGISKVTIIEDIDKAIELAFKEDNEILIETAIVGVEVSVGAYKKENQIKVLMPTEIVSENDFFDYEAKYLGKSDEITPARISEEMIVAVQEITKKIYSILNMSSVTRCDFIIQDDIPFFIEINTTPGLSKESIIPKQVRYNGTELKDFFSDLINEALSKNFN